jgi:hypothetical protein
MTTMSIITATHHVVVQYCKEEDGTLEASNKTFNEGIRKPLVKEGALKTFKEMFTRP